MFVKMESRADNNIYEHLKFWLQCEMAWLRRRQERWIPVEERENVEFPSNQPSSWYSFGSRSNQAEPTVQMIWQEHYLNKVHKTLGHLFH